MTPEGKVKRAVVRILDEAGAYYFYPVTGGYGKSGVPDIVVCFKGHFVGIECKAGSNQPTSLQQRELKRIATAGGSALVINEANISDVTELLNHVRNHMLAV